MVSVSKDFIAQVGDPSATGKGGECFASWHHKQQQQQRKSAQRGIDAPARYFRPEILNSLKHTSRGTVSMAVAPTLASTDGTGEVVGGCGSQFFVTLADEIEYLDGKHAVFGHVVEGFDVLDKLNDVFVDQEGRPLKDVRIRHIEVLGEGRGELRWTSSASLLTCHPPLSLRGPISGPRGRDRGTRVSGVTTR